MIEQLFEKVLWQSRLVIVVAVIASLFTAFVMLYLTTVDVVYMISHLGEYASPEMTESARKSLHATTVGHVVEIIDGYLLSSVLLIFALGLYELFVSKIDIASASEQSSNVLIINSMDDLKDRLAKVILMILIVKFFEYVIAMTYSTPLELLYLATGIALVGLALYLTHARSH